MTPEEKAAADLAAAEAAKKITFTEDQQTAINNLINQRFAKVSEKHETEKKTLADQNAALQAQLDELKNGKGGKKEGENDDPKEKQYKDLLANEKSQTSAAKDALSKETERSKTLASENLRIRKEIAIRDSAQGRFLDMEVVMAMVQDKIEYDEDTKTFVVREGGIVRQNASLQNMTLEEYFEDFGKKRPFLVRSDVVGGAGSTENKGGAGSNFGVVKTKADLKTMKEKSDYITKFGLKAFETLPLK